MKEKIEACFDRLQTLKIDSTIDNMEKLLQTLYDLREVYQALEGGEQSNENSAEKWNGN